LISHTIPTLTKTEFLKKLFSIMAAAVPAATMLMKLLTKKFIPVMVC